MGQSKNKPDRDYARGERQRRGLPGPIAQAQKLLAGDQSRQFEIVLSCVRRGSYIETACRVAGISRQTFYVWCAKGNQGKAPYADFLVRLGQAQGSSVMDMLDVIDLAAARGDWKAGAWRLERMYPQLYGQKLEVTERVDYDPGAPEAVEKVNLARLSLKQKKEMRALIAAAGGRGPIDIEGEEIS